MGTDVIATVTAPASSCTPLPQFSLREGMALIKAARHLKAEGFANSAMVSWDHWSSALRAVGQSDQQLALWRKRFEHGTVFGPRTVVSDVDGRMVDLSVALLQARRSSTGLEFNQALRTLMITAQRTQGQIERHDRDEGQRQLSRSTISRMVSGDRLCSRREQVDAFVRACNHGHEAELWIGAWKAAREGRSAADTDISMDPLLPFTDEIFPEVSGRSIFIIWLTLATISIGLLLWASRD